MYGIDVQKEYLVEKYVDGMVIITDEEGNVYYMECEEDCAPVGTVVEECGLKRLDTLDMKEQKKILSLLED